MTRIPFDELPEPDLTGMGDPIPRRAVYEDRAVRYVCAQLRLPNYAQRVARESEARTGHYSARFVEFDALTSFPIRFRVGKLRRIRFLTVPDLFNRFTTTPIVKALNDLIRELDPAEAPVGLVFAWPGLQGPDGRSHAVKGGRFMTAHTAPIPDWTAATRVVAMVPSRRDPIMVVIETMASCLAAYRHWQPPT